MFGPSSDSSFRHGAPAQFGMGPEGRWPACPPADRGRGVACPTCGGGVCPLVLRGEKSPRTRRPAPRKLPGSHPDAAQRKKRFPSTYPGHFDGKRETENKKFFRKFFSRFPGHGQSKFLPPDHSHHRTWQSPGWSSPVNSMRRSAVPGTAAVG